MTQTEKHVCKLWQRAENSGDWWACWQAFSEIYFAFEASGCDETASELYGGAYTLALALVTFDIQTREAA